MKHVQTELDYRRIDPLIHSRIRLALMSVLTRVDDISFNELKKILNATDGNLSTHLSKLADVGYVALEKDTEAERPETRIHVTQKGLTAFASYIMELEPFIG
jgi:DNA-binding MarR family transcriptional regulator